jgi:hypothetical protein
MIHLSIDVESVGLYGEPFAIGWVLYENKVEIESGLLQCNVDNAEGTVANKEWVKENVVPALQNNYINNFDCSQMYVVPELQYRYTYDVIYGTVNDMLSDFWYNHWLRLKENYHNMIVLSDCNYPVETNMFKKCIELDPNTNEWYGPFPLHDIASILFAHGKNPLETYDRLENELPIHNPVCDARNSYRKIVEFI